MRPSKYNTCSMNNSIDLVISSYQDGLKVRELTYSFLDIVSFDLLGTFESNFSYTLLNQSCDLVTIFSDNKEIKIAKGEMIEVKDYRELGKYNLYRLEILKDGVSKNAIIELVDEFNILSEVHLTLRGFILSTNHFDNVKIFEGKVKLNEAYYSSEKRKLEILKVSNENIASLLFALNELKNNLSFSTKKELVKKIDLLKEDPTLDIAHSGYIEVNKDFVFVRKKKYLTPENILLFKTLNSLSESSMSLKSLVSMFIKRMNSEIVSYNALIKSDKKKNISKTNSIKIATLYKTKKELIIELNGLLERLKANISMILNILMKDCEGKEYDFTSFVLTNDKYYRNVFNILSNQVSFNVNFDFLRVTLTHLKTKFMLNDLVSLYELIALDKVLNDFGYKNVSSKNLEIKKLENSTYIYRKDDEFISLDYFKFKKKSRNETSRPDFLATFVLKEKTKDDEVLKTMVIDSYSKVLDSSIIKKDYKDEFMIMKNESSNLYFEGNLINKYIFTILKNSSKFRNDYIYSFANCSSYILSLYRNFKNQVEDFLFDSLTLEETVFVEM